MGLIHDVVLSSSSGLSLVVGFAVVVDTDDAASAGVNCSSGQSPGSKGVKGRREEEGLVEDEEEERLLLSILAPNKTSVGIRSVGLYCDESY